MACGGGDGGGCRGEGKGNSLLEGKGNCWFTVTGGGSHGLGRGRRGFSCSYMIREI